MNTYTVPRVQGTYTDVLTVIGLANLLLALKADPKTIRIQQKNVQDSFQVSGDTRIRIQDLDGVELFTYIRVKGEESPRHKFFDYEHQSKKRTDALAWKKANKSQKWEDAPDGIEKPRSDWGVYQAIYSLVYFVNSPVHRIAYNQITSDLGKFYIQKILQQFGDNESESLIIVGKPPSKLIDTVTALQIVNPIQGMGAWSKKADNAKLRNIESPLHMEILKFSGWQTSSHPIEIFVDNKGQKRDIKVFVVEPKDISIDDYTDIVRKIRESTSFSNKNYPIKFDILFNIELSEVILNHNEKKFVKRGRISKVISGFYTVIFQQMGKAKSSMSQGFLALPNWIVIENDEERKTWLDILKEHRQIIRNLDESHSEERNLLEKYRDFLSGQDVRAFLEFLSDYGPHVLRLADRGKYALWMQTEHLGRVIRNMVKNDITSIISDTGFQNVAGAIRRATRSALYAKKNNDRTYDVHYGLAQELKRSAVTKAKFMAALSDFVTEYMTENLRAADRGKKGRVAVTTEDLLAVGKLLDEHDPQMVAMLLIAYGYAKEPKDDTPETIQTEDIDTIQEENQ